MCCDVPVVTSNISSMPEAGGDAALYADPTNPSEIAKQLKLIIDSEAQGGTLRQELIEKGRVQREKFSQHKIIADFYDLYCSLVPEMKEED